MFKLNDKNTTISSKICLEFLNDPFRGTLKAFDDFKSKKKMYGVMFIDRQKYVYFESLFITLHTEIKQKC